MATKTQVPLEQYLSMSFDGADCDYLNGEIVERNVGNKGHSKVQGALTGIFYALRSRFLLHVFPELRMKVSERRYRVADLAIYRGEEPGELVPSQPPFLVIEVLSPDDRMSDVLAKLAEYRDWGVAHVWLVDPETEAIYVYEKSGLGKVENLEVTQFGIRVEGANIFK